jgi:hypothetical protein
MKKNLVAKALFVLFLIFIVWMIDFGGRPDFYINEIRAGYKGIVVDRLEKKTTLLKIKAEDGKVIEVGILCNELKAAAEIGDEIEKIPNENYVLLSKDSGVLKLPYLYISEKIREDRRWPKEWKDKWPESTY